MPSHTPTGPVTPFGERLIAACELRGISLRELGRRAGYKGKTSARPIQLTRTRRPTVAVVERLAKALGIDRSELDPELTPSGQEAMKPKKKKIG